MNYIALLLGLNILELFAIMYLIGNMACMIYSMKERIEKFEKIIRRI